MVLLYSGLQRIPELSKIIKFPETFDLTKNVWTIQNKYLSGELKNIQTPFFFFLIWLYFIETLKISCDREQIFEW